VNTGELSSSAGGTVNLSDNKANVNLPAGALTGNGTVSIMPTTVYTAPSADKQVIGSKVYDLTAKVGSLAVTTFNKAVTLTFTYSDDDIKGLDESNLLVYYYDETSGIWISLGGMVDAANNKITADTTHFTKFAVLGKAAAASGSLIKLACVAKAGLDDPCRAVYHLATNGKRYVFPDQKTYNTWYSDFSTVKTVTASEMSSYVLGGLVTYRPGVLLVKYTTDSKVYAVSQNGVLRHVGSEAVAQSLYGIDWAKQVRDLLDVTVSSYTYGAEITASADFDKTGQTNSATSISLDKKL
jgi:hypothetical protein